MASMHPFSERRMLLRYTQPRNEQPMGGHAALHMFMIVLMVMLVAGAAYYYASYRYETHYYDMLLSVPAP